jgi:hypothetical protein
LAGPTPYEGREENLEIELDLEGGGFAEDLPFDVNFKVTGPMPAGFGAGSRLDARFVEFERPPDCATFFNQFTLSRGRLPDLNETDSIPVRRRRQSGAREQSGFTQATVFSDDGPRLTNAVVIGDPTAGDPAVAKPASFLASFPALRPNHYYCFQFISRRALSGTDLENLHLAFEEVVDGELRKEKYQEERGDYTTFKVGVEDYERLRVELSAAIEGALGANNRVILAPQDSFFNVGAQLADIKARYREEFEQIAIKTVGARLVAIDAFEQEAGNAIRALRTLAVTDFEVKGEEGGDEDENENEDENEDSSSEPVKMRGDALIRKYAAEDSVVEFMARLSDVGIEAGELASLPEEQLKRRFTGLTDSEQTNSDLRGVWDVESIQPRIDSLQALSRSLGSLITLADREDISLVSDQVDVTPVTDQEIETTVKLLNDNKARLCRIKKAQELPDEDECEEALKNFDPEEFEGATRQDLEGLNAEAVTDIAGLEEDLKKQREGKNKAKIKPQVDLVYQATRFLDGAVTHLRSLQKLLENRSALIAEWVRQVLVEEQASLVVGGTTVADYDTRAIWYMSADLGSGISELEDFFTYVGWNIYFRPVNKKAHLSWKARPFGIGEEIMRRLSFTLGVVQTGFDDKDGQFEGVIGGNPAVMGVGFRINDSLRFSLGGLVFDSLNPDPLIDSSELSWSPYAAISLDWNIGGSLSGLLPGN